ncbi:hypothetical protein GE09DRAFT_411906 [Coniochaeta sp. 2T2.1]|nr:hypothetical protein GE09DRAFT_411906 [Coniochaeta sp. 2T2.1]
MRAEVPLRWLPSGTSSVFPGPHATAERAIVRAHVYFPSRYLMDRTESILCGVCQPEGLTKEIAESVMKSCPKLTSLVVGPTSRLFLFEPDSILCDALKSFPGLQSLMLAGLTSHLESYKSGIISALLACPALQEFGVSTRPNELPPSLSRLNSTSTLHQYLGAFPDICRGYAQRGGLPLRLKRLTLSLGVGFRRENIDLGVVAEEAGLTAPSCEWYLSQLLDPSVLEEVYVANTGEFKYCQAWWSFGQDKTPNLRRLAADTYTENLSRSSRTATRSTPRHWRFSSPPRQIAAALVVSSPNAWFVDHHAV